MENPRVQTLIETLEFSQNLAVWYISLLKEIDPYKVFEVEGKSLNSVYWIVGHLAWAENMLILEGTRGEAVESEHLDKFRIGDAHAVLPDLDFAGVKALAQEVHQKTLAHLESLNDSDLDLPNTKNFGFGKEPTNQVIIMHAIRHIGTHTGHLSWLCLLNHIKTV